MKKFILSIIAMFTVMCATPAFATELPQDVKNYILENVPNTTIRFDSLITMPDGTQYLPLIPAYSVKDAEFGVKYTYPENKSTLAKRPEILIFNNNYCLLKLIKDKKTSTVADLKEFPIEIRTGLLPQDLLVPKGLVLPDTLVGILGDLNIPLTSNLKIDTRVLPPIPSTADKTELPEKAEPISVIPQLRDKQFYITNFSSNYIYIMPSNLRDVQYTLKLDSIPKTVNVIGENYLLVSTAGKTYIDVVDIKNEEIAKQIDLGTEPDELVLTKNEKTAYVISSESSFLYVINIPTMTLTKQIQIKGKPEKLSLSDDETKLIYQDSETSDIYSVELKNEYVNIYQCNVPNVSKVLLIDNKVYALSRTKNMLKIYPYQEVVITKNEQNEEVLSSRKAFYLKSALVATGPEVKRLKQKQKEIAVAESEPFDGDKIVTSVKPVDVIYKNGKLYVLGSVENVIDVVDTKTQKVEKTIALKIAGFSTKLNQIKNSDLVLVTNVMEKKYVVVDLKKEAVLQVNPIDVPITTITVIDKEPESL